MWRDETGNDAKRVCNFEMILIYNHDPHLPKVREYLIMMILIYNDHALKHVQVYKHDSCNILLQHHSSCPHFCFHATWQSGNAKQKYIERNVFHTITIWSTMSIFRSDMWDTISIYFNAFSWLIWLIWINQSTSTWIWKCTEPQMCHRGRSQFLVVPGRYPNGISCWKMATCEFPKAALTQHTRLLSSQSKEQHSLRFYM